MLPILIINLTSSPEPLNKLRPELVSLLQFSLVLVEEFEEILRLWSILRYDVYRFWPIYVVPHFSTLWVHCVRCLCRLSMLTIIIVTCNPLEILDLMSFACMNVSICHDNLPFAVKLLSFLLVLDTCYVLSFSIIMLNTSLHNPNVREKPSVESFIKMNNGINEGGDLPQDLLKVSCLVILYISRSLMFLSTFTKVLCWNCASRQRVSFAWNLKWAKFQIEGGCNL